MNVRKKRCNKNDNDYDVLRSSDSGHSGRKVSPSRDGKKNKQESKCLEKYSHVKPIREGPMSKVMYGRKKQSLPTKVMLFVLLLNNFTNLEEHGGCLLILVQHHIYDTRRTYLRVFVKLLMFELKLVSTEMFIKT